ncbi:MAG: hypothetical protein R3C10_19300 [Pirellulales bacterium]|nr:hypothetical protein [Planctomycetales bacterium]
MRTDRQRGSVVISVDVTTDSPPLLAEIPRLLDLFDRLSLSATWALDDAAGVELARQIAVRTAGHELALLVGPDALDDDASRGEVARYVVARQEQLAEADLTATTLAGEQSAAWLERDVDLLAKHGIETVRFGASCNDSAMIKRRLPAVLGVCDWLWAGAAPMVHPQNVRYGVWSLPGSMSMPAAVPHTRLAADVARVGRSVETAAADGGVFHLVVHLERLLVRNTQGEMSLVSVLKRISHARAEGRLDVGTASQVTQQWARPSRTTVPARSILRAA